MKSVRHSTALAAIVCGSVAQADVTAQQVWDNWSAQMDVYGDGFSTGGEAMDGATLTVSDILITASDDDSSVRAQIGDIQLTENGDGTVTVTMAEQYPITIKNSQNADDPVTLNVIVAQSAMDLIVSGDPDAMIYDLKADSYSMRIDSIEGREAADATLNAAAFTMNDLVGTYGVAIDTMTNVAYAFSVGSLDLDLDIADIDEMGSFVRLTGDIANLAMSADLVLPPDMDMAADQPPFSDGLAISGGYAFGQTAYTFDVMSGPEGEAVSGTGSSSGGDLAIALDVDGVSYSGESRDIAVSISIPNELPFPIEASLAKYGFDFLLPLSRGDGEPRDARFAFNLTDLTLDDAIWALGDPENILPRDPLTIALGVDARVTPFFDYLDPAQQEAAMMADVPGEINALEITELTVRGAGADITGGGAFTFDNDDLTTFDGFPRPQGSMTFNINGVNGLVDDLIAMGLVPQDQAMMPRMMLGMFASPVGDDMLTSTIEVNDEGHVLANGQRLR